MASDNTFYIGVASWDNSDPANPVCMLDPNATTSWTTGGSFVTLAIN